MPTRLSRMCDAIIEAGWLAALIVTPLFFNTFSSRVFEPDKLHLLRSIALVMAVAWIVQLADGGIGSGGLSGLWQRVRRTPLVLPALALVLAYGVSTLLSVTPRISFFGSYVRMQGTYTFLSYVAIFVMTLTHLRTRSQLMRLIHAIVLSSLPISIYGIIQHYRLDPLPWGGDVTERVAANMGNAIFVAAYLIIAFFLTLERLFDSITAVLDEERGSLADALRAGAYLFILAVQSITIVFTQSRGPWLGLIGGGYLFVMLGLLLLGRWAVGRPRMPRWLKQAVRPAWALLLVSTILIVAFVGILNVPDGPLSALCDLRYLGRVCTLASLSEGTNAVRVLIWEGVVDMMLKPHAPIPYPDGSVDTLNPIRPLIGYGPESMWVAYNNFYPPELAHYEARNASPDRSHNETFDTLVRTGLLGFGIQLWLFGSVFYYALRWLGLLQGRGRRNLFLGLMIGGALLGVVVPLLADGSLRLAGLGLPVGLIVGVIAYVTTDLFLTPLDKIAGRPENTAGAISGRRQLLILALFAAVVAHFVEVHFGIAIASTLTHFWTLMAVLVVVGMGWIEEETAPAPVPQPVEPKPVAAVNRTPVAAKGPARKGKGKTAPARREGQQRSPQPAHATEAPPRQPTRTRAASDLLALLPYVGIGMIITLVFTWTYTVNQTGQTNAFSVLWAAFTTRVDSGSFRIVASPMLLVLAIFTWTIGGLLAIAESSANRPTGKSGRWGTKIGIYAGAMIATWLGYGLYQADRILLRGLTGMDIFHRLAGHIAAFDAVLLGVGLLTAAAIWAADPRPRPLHRFQALPIFSLSAGAIAAAVALLIIINVNVRTVQADTYYKQGLAYEGAGQPESAAVLYRQAAILQPQEDYYYLFLGRVLLQFSASLGAGPTTLPDDLTTTPTSEMLSLIERALRVRSREEILRGAHAALTAAQRLNPLNTDHSANLARLNRSWAFVNALGPNDVPNIATLRQIVATRPQDVGMARLNASLTFYRQATTLSPQNAQLWNELAEIQFILGDTAAALRTLDRSQALDSLYTKTYLTRGDMLAAIGDKAGALAAYRQVAALAPGDVAVQSAVGVYSAQTGDLEGALAAFRKMAEAQEAALASTQAQLTSHEALVSRNGGYTALLPSAAARRDALQGALATQRSQLHLAYRNISLVLRDAGRLQEALTAARTALTYANEDERPTIEALIGDLQKRLAGG